LKKKKKKKKKAQSVIMILSAQKGKEESNAYEINPVVQTVQMQTIKTLAKSGTLVTTTFTSKATLH
jgi:hypothetical protein